MTVTESLAGSGNDLIFDRGCADKKIGESGGKLRQQVSWVTPSTQPKRQEKRCLCLLLFCHYSCLNLPHFPLLISKHPRMGPPHQNYFLFGTILKHFLGLHQQFQEVLRTPWFFFFFTGGAPCWSTPAPPAPRGLSFSKFHFMQTHKTLFKYIHYSETRNNCCLCLHFIELAAQYRCYTSREWLFDYTCIQYISLTPSQNCTLLI